ncbi:MAG: FAD-dependent oxidoreductase [Bdellovibrionota bacterium]|nr:FAD-dependent oxidoreductase [Bdellovibrionota bacterium]
MTKVWVIIGGGISTYVFLDSFLEKVPKGHRVVHIKGQDMAPSCSLNSTAVCCLQGTQKGVSPLGDLLVESYALASSFFEKEHPEGVVKGKQYNQCELDGKNSVIEYERRFKSVDDLKALGPFKNPLTPQKGKVWDAYFIDPAVYLKWFSKRVKKKAKDRGINYLEFYDFVTDITYDLNEGIILETHSEAFFKADQLILATGAYSKLMKGFLPGQYEQLEKAKVVSGSYLVFENTGSDFKYEESFCIAYKGHNFIYQHWNKCFLIGGTTDSNDEGALKAPQVVKLKEMYDVGKNELKLPLPPFEKGKTPVGLRQKGIKRMPFWGPLGKEKDNIYGILSLYKNGYTFSFKAARDLCSKLL